MKNLSLANLSKKEMSYLNVKGGWVWTWPSSADVECGCNCLFADSGGSSVTANGEANKEQNLFSPEQ